MGAWEKRSRRWEKGGWEAGVQRWRELAEIEKNFGKGQEAGVKGTGSRRLRPPCPHPQKCEAKPLIQKLLGTHFLNRG